MGVRRCLGNRYSWLVDLLRGTTRNWATISTSTILRAGGCAKVSSKASGARSNLARRALKRLAAAPSCAPRNGRSTAGASTRNRRVPSSCSRIATEHGRGRARIARGGQCQRPSSGHGTQPQRRRPGRRRAPRRMARAEAGRDVAALSGRARALSPLAGRRPERSAAAVYDRQQARWRRLVVTTRWATANIRSSRPTSTISARRCRPSRRSPTRAPSSCRWSRSQNLRGSSSAILTPWKKRA